MRVTRRNLTTLDNEVLGIGDADECGRHSNVKQRSSLPFLNQKRKTILGRVDVSDVVYVISNNENVLLYSSSSSSSTVAADRQSHIARATEKKRKK